MVDNEEQAMLAPQEGDKLMSLQQLDDDQDTTQWKQEYHALMDIHKELKEQYTDQQSKCKELWDSISHWKSVTTQHEATIGKLQKSLERGI